MKYDEARVHVGYFVTLTLFGIAIGGIMHGCGPFP